MITIDILRNSLDHTPRLKAVVKRLFAPVIASMHARSIEKYNKWLAAHVPSLDELSAQAQSAKLFDYRPLISIVVPVYEPAERYFIEMLQSVYAQSYDNWELILVDDASPTSTARDIIQKHAQSEPRIMYAFLQKNHHISGATNEAIKRASGEFIALLDNDDILQPDALYEVVAALNEDAARDFIYSDEDKLLGDTGRHASPYFKPTWNPDFLYSVNYITHFSVIRKKVVDAVGGLDSKYDGAQDWELFFRVTRTIDPAGIYHIPKILYSWRVHEASTADDIGAKPYVIEAQRQAITSALDAHNYSDYKLQEDGHYPAQWHVEFPLTTTPQVAVVVPDEETAAHIRESVGYSKYEIIVQTAGGVLDRAIAQSDYVLFVNVSLVTYNAHLIEQMLADAQRPDIGFVSARYPLAEDALFNIGHLISADAAAFVETTSWRDLTKHFYSTTRHNIPCVSNKSCLMVETKKLREVMTDKVRSDIVEMSSAVHQSGYRNLYNPYISMI